MATILCIVLGAYIVFLQISHRLERKDLYNRIMADDLVDYKNDKKPKLVSSYKRGT
jgi:hypothetical protein